MLEDLVINHLILKEQETQHHQMELYLMEKLIWTK